MLYSNSIYFSVCAFRAGAKIRNTIVSEDALDYNNHNNYGRYESTANRIAAGVLIIIISAIASLSLFNAIGGVGRMISGFFTGDFRLCFLRVRVMRRGNWRGGDVWQARDAPR
jgi:hypothetical protein